MSSDEARDLIRAEAAQHPDEQFDVQILAEGSTVTCVYIDGRKSWPR